MSARLQRIVVYPIKSLDGVEVESSEITARGGLKHDRCFAMRDAAGRIINAKRTPAVHHIRARYDLAETRVTVWPNGEQTSSKEFHLDRDRDALAAWLSTEIGISLELDEDPDGGFPDDTDAAGPTLISEASLEEIGNWFPELTVSDIRRRFRTNLEVTGVPAFWEDRLVPEVGMRGRVFAIGAVTLEGRKACTRCAVPARDPNTGATLAGFAKSFAARRERSLPPQAPTTRFDHFWRLALNTRLAEDQAGHILRVGDAIDHSG